MKKALSFLSGGVSYSCRLALTAQSVVGKVNLHDDLELPELGWYISCERPRFGVGFISGATGQSNEGGGTSDTKQSQHQT